MNDHEAKQYVLERISVTRQQVTLAQAFIAELSGTVKDSSILISRLRQHMDANMPKEIVLHTSVDPLPTLDQVVKSITWQLAASEAIWKLIHSTILLPLSLSLIDFEENIKWTSVVPGSGGYSGGLNFKEFTIVVPREVMRAYSFSAKEQTLTNPDLYMHEININNMDSDIETSLREAVECLRHELLTASLAMLSKAAEGAWLELGKSLLQYVPAADQTKIEKQKKNLENSDVGSGKKVQEILTLYERQDIFKSITQQSGINLQDLRMAANWSEIIRDSRNTVHYGVQPAMSNTYEKVVALFIGAIPHFRKMYLLKETVDANII